MRQLIPYEEAKKVILSYPLKLDVEEVDIMESVGRVLAEPVIAGDNVPPFNRSPLDGFAIWTGDTQLATPDNPVRLAIIEEVAAGKVAKKKIIPGTAVKLTTGTCLPAGADGVVPYEITEFDEQHVAITTPFQTNSNISFAGEDVARGEQVVPANTLITPETVGMMAALGIATINVWHKPRIAIISTGDELVDLTGHLAPGKIRNSNLYTLAALLSQLGCEPVLYGIVPDLLEQTAERLIKALECDLVISTGGVSVGDYDVVKEAMTAIGARILFWRVNIRPGTPAVCSEKEGKLLIGLSGNPAAAMISFELLVKPLLKKSLGLPYQPNVVKGKMVGGYAKVTNQLRFLRARTSWKQGEIVTALAGMQNPGVMKSILHCNSLIIIPAGKGPYQAGDLVDIILTRELEVGR